MADERDPKVSQRYRELGAEEPPRALDESILAAARRASASPHAPLVTPAGRHRWYFSLAAAAILVLAVAVTWHIEREQPDGESLAMRQDAAPQKKQPADRLEPAQPASPPRASPGFASEAKPEIQQAPGELARDAAPAAQAPAEVRGSLAKSRVAEENKSESPERWLERIVELRKEGKDDEADKALAEFRKRYPDYAIPQAKLEQVEKKK